MMPQAHPAAGYSLSATRMGMDGIQDKVALIEAMADKYSVDRDFQSLVLSKIQSAGSPADEQLWAWERFVESRPYRREPSEILRDPLETAAYGGDCDDLTVLTLAGCKALEIPCEAEVVADSSERGFHVRAVAALPPINPQFTVILDPVYRSEPEWAMAKRDLHSASAKFHGVNHNDPRLHSQNLGQITGLSPQGKTIAGLLLASLLLLLFLRKK